MSMTVIMNDSDVCTLDQVKRVLKAAKVLKFRGLSRQDKYNWLNDIIRRFKYHQLCKKDKGPLRRYMMMATGLSRPQLSRLIKRNLISDAMEPFSGKRNRFANTYTRADIELLAETDNLHERMSVPACKSFASLGDFA